jgi:hypothetical protein
MGRRQITEPPVPPGYICEVFAINVTPEGKGVLIGAERPPSHFPHRPDDHTRWNRKHAARPVGFMVNGAPMVRFKYQNATRRMSILKVSWIVSTGEYPHGSVRARDGDAWNVAPDNLILVKRGPDPFSISKASRARSLIDRAEADGKLLRALAANPKTTVAALSRLTGSSKPCVCRRLAKLEQGNLTCGPKCAARLRWDISPHGRAVATKDHPLLDALDKSILTVLARASVRATALAGLVGVCLLTAQRRVGLLVGHGLVEADKDKHFKITGKARAPWAMQRLDRG